MNITDIIALAKAGYKKADIKELLELETDNPNNSESKPTETQTEGAPEVTEEKNVTVQPESKEPELDYKALYEQSQAELKKAQQKNINKDVSNVQQGPSDMDILNDITASFM